MDKDNEHLYIINGKFNDAGEPILGTGELVDEKTWEAYNKTEINKEMASRLQAFFDEGGLGGLNEQHEGRDYSAHKESQNYDTALKIYNTIKVDEMSENSLVKNISEQEFANAAVNVDQHRDALEFIYEYEEALTSVEENRTWFGKAVRQALNVVGVINTPAQQAYYDKNPKEMVKQFDKLKENVEVGHQRADFGLGTEMYVNSEFGGPQNLVPKIAKFAKHTAVAEFEVYRVAKNMLNAIPGINVGKER